MAPALLRHFAIALRKSTAQSHQLVLSPFCVNVLFRFESILYTSNCASEAQISFFRPQSVVGQLTGIGLAWVSIKSGDGGDGDVGFSVKVRACLWHQFRNNLHLDFVVFAIVFNFVAEAWQSGRMRRS